MPGHDATALRTDLPDLACLRDPGTALDDSNPDRDLNGSTRFNDIRKRGQHLDRHPVEAAIIEGRSSIEREKERGGLFLSGDPGLARSMNRWLRTSVYAAFEGVRQLS